MIDIQLDECYKYVLDTILKCGEIMKKGSKNLGTVKVKEFWWDLVTEYDRNIENVFIEDISKKYPDHKFIGEETTSSTNITPTLTDHPTWIIDPIDGTTNFVHGVNICCISVAFVVNKELVFGFNYNPLQNELYTARKGKGAFLNGEQIHASKVEKIEDSLIAHEVSLASKQSVADKNIERVRAFVSRSQGIRSFGCAALTLCYVARGTIDAYQVDDLKPWDIAAGALILREAGGVVMDTSGGEYDIMNPNVITAGTPQMAQTILEIIREVEVLLKKM